MSALFLFLTPLARPIPNGSQARICSGDSKVRGKAYLGQVILKNGQWQITAEPDVMLALKRIFPKVDTRKTGVLLLANTPESAADLLWVAQRYPLEFKDEVYIQNQAAQHAAQQARIKTILENGSTNTYSMALEPREYQKVAAEVLALKKSLLLADEMGLGKTVSALAFLCNPTHRGAVIVVQAHLCVQWGEFIKSLLPRSDLRLRGHLSPTRYRKIQKCSLFPIINWRDGNFT